MEEKNNTRGKPNYSLKSKLFAMEEEKSVITIYNRLRRVEYCENFGIPYEHLYSREYLYYCYEQYFLLEPDIVAECERIISANHARCLRLRKKIDYLLSHYSCTFLTMTFTEAYLSSTSVSTRRQNVSRFLNSLECPYIANIDYGSLFEREHYHAVVACRIPLTKKRLYDSKYGNLDMQAIRVGPYDSARLARYVSKLANHAVKDTARRNSLLYSRKYKIPVD